MLEIISAFLILEGVLFVTSPTQRVTFLVFYKESKSHPTEAIPFTQYSFDNFI